MHVFCQFFVCLGCVRRKGKKRGRFRKEKKKTIFEDERQTLGTVSPGRPSRELSANITAISVRGCFPRKKKKKKKENKDNKIASFLFLTIPLTFLSLHQKN